MPVVFKFHASSLTTFTSQGRLLAVNLKLLTRQMKNLYRQCGGTERISSKSDVKTSSLSYTEDMKGDLNLWKIGMLFCSISHCDPEQRYCDYRFSLAII